MTLKEKIKISPVEIKAAYISFFVSIGLSVLSIPFVFFGLYDITLGLMLGLLIGYCCYLLLVYQVKHTLSFKHPKATGTFNYLIRFVLYGLGIALALLLNHFNIKLFNVYLVASGYMVSIVTLLIVSLVTKDYTTISNSITIENNGKEEQNNEKID